MPATAALSVAAPAAIFLVGAGVLHRRSAIGRELAPLAVTTLLILGAAIAAGVIGVPLAVLAIGLVVTGLVARSVAGIYREGM